MAHVDYRIVAARAGSLQFASTRTVVPVVRTGDHFDRTGRTRLPSLLPSALSLESAAKSGRPGTTRRTRASLQGSRHSPQRRGQPHSGGARLRRGSGRPLGRDLEPRIAGFAGDCVVQEVIRQKIVSTAISGRSRQADSFTDPTARTLLHVALRAEVLDVQLMPTESPRLEFPFAEAALASPLQFHEDRLHLAPYGALLFILLLAAELLGSPFRPRTPARDILLDPRTKLLEGRGVADQDAVPDSSAISSQAASPSPTRVLSMSSRIRRVCVPERVVWRPKSSVRRI